MASRGINYNTIFESVIHYEPSSYFKDLVNTEDEKYPMYALSGDSSDTSGLMANEVKDLTSRSNNWKVKVKETYSSPTNIKIAILTPNKCVIVFHRPPIENGKEASYGIYKIISTSRATKFRSGSDVKLIDAIRDHKDYFNKDLNNNKSSYKITGNVLRSFHTPWTVSNIEEIIVDASLLESDDLNTRNATMVGKSQVMSWAKAGFNVEDLREIPKKYPRLRGVAVVNNLEKYLNDSPSKLNFKNLTQLPEFISSSIIIKFSKFNLDDLGSLVIRTYYKFDKEILAVYNRKLMRDAAKQINEELESRKAAELQNETNYINNQKNKTKFEYKLEALEAQSGISNCRSIASILLNINKYGSDRAKSIDIKSEFLSEETYKKYFG